MIYKVAKKIIKQEMPEGLIDVTVPDIPEGTDFKAIDCEDYFIVQTQKKLGIKELSKEAVKPFLGKYNEEQIKKFLG